MLCKVGEGPLSHEFLAERAILNNQRLASRKESFDRRTIEPATRQCRARRRRASAQHHMPTPRPRACERTKEVGLASERRKWVWDLGGSSGGKCREAVYIPDKDRPLLGGDGRAAAVDRLIASRLNHAASSHQHSHSGTQRHSAAGIASVFAACFAVTFAKWPQRQGCLALVLEDAILRPGLCSYPRRTMRRVDGQARPWRRGGRGKISSSRPAALRPLRLGRRWRFSRRVLELRVCA